VAINMNELATSTISITDLLSFSQGIAQLNLGYLGISVAILGGLGGVFVYFNLKPLKDGLTKQEKAIEDLRKEAHELLQQSKDKVDQSLKEFESKQLDMVESIVRKQKEDSGLETTNKIQEVEKNLTEKISSISEEKDTKLKEITLSEASNQISALEKSLTLIINTSRESATKDLNGLNLRVAGIDAKVKEAGEQIKELQVYKFSKEGQMGGMIYSNELLKDAIDEYLNLQKAGSDAYAWKVTMRLEELTKNVTGYLLQTQFIAQIEEQLKRIDSSTDFKEPIKKLRESMKTE
jgi:F0F1-type ATP synthase membrane subunit b/b'